MLKQFTVKANSIACWINPHDFGAHGRSLVFVHGSGSNSSAWACQYGRLHRGFNIAAVNLPGHGGSTGKGEEEVAGYANRVKEILETLGLARPILIGHSMGAAIAVALAAAHPEAISGIVLTGGSATLPVNADILDGLTKNPDAALDLICKFSLAKVNRPKLHDALKASMSASGVEILAGDMRACNKVNLTGELVRITVPALVVCGAEDKMTPPEASRALAAGIRGARLVFIESAGHMAMMENPDAFNDALVNFLSEIK